MHLAPRLLFAGLLLLHVLPAPLHAADPSADSLILTGAQAAGIASLSFAGNVYTFKYQGDELLTYTLNVADPKVAGGMLTIHEVSSDSNPVDGAGVVFRNAAGTYTYPTDLWPLTTLLNHSASGTTLTLNYQVNVNGAHPVRYEITLLQKQLRIRFVDTSGSLFYANNFNGSVLGRSTGVETPVRIQMQGTLAEPITLFRNVVAGNTQHYFVANVFDMLQSNASDFNNLNLSTPSFGADWADTALSTATRYRPLSDGKFAAPLDDAYAVVVSAKVKDVLVSSTAATSPYLGLLANRMFVNCPERVWSWYDSMFDVYDYLGMHNLVAYFFEWSSGAVDPPNINNVGPDWAPAIDQWAFEAMLEKGRSHGNLVGAYSSFNCAPPTAPSAVNNPAEYARDAAGVAKQWTAMDFPLLGVQASATHANAEMAALKALDANAAYLDIQTYGCLSQAPDGDHLDQQAHSPWAKTHRTGFAAQKTWIEGMRTILEGPLLGEGSIATIKSNMEYLWYGYVDSLQRCINTASGQNASLVPAGSPFAPTHWQIIPEYEWRVAARKQINHGNGFYDRFFGKTDGPGIVNMATGLPKYPLSQDAVDLYQAYLITYGHAGYITTNGVQSGNEGYLTTGQVAQTYFMSNALQWRYYSSPIVLIRYRSGNAWKNFEPILFAAESTEPFRHIPVAMLFANGLHMYINHGPVPLVINEGGVAYTLPAKTGWWAGDGGGLLAFSAIPPTTGGQRIDYCRASGQYEYFNGRGAVESYGGQTTPFKLSSWIDYTTNLTIGEDQYGNFWPDQYVPAPTLAGVLLYPGNLTLGVGQRIGLRTFLVFSNNSIRDSTTVATWASSNPLVAKVNAAGVLEAVGAGSTQISAVMPGGTSATPITVTVP